MDINRFALFSLAISDRWFKGINLSVLRVMITLTSSISWLSKSCTFLAIDKAIFFSSEYAPWAPGSLPPWPASITMVLNLKDGLGGCPKQETDRNKNKALTKIFNPGLILVIDKLRAN